MSEQQWTWQPVDNQEDAITAAMQHILRWDKLPADIALCRRVPAPAQGVPVDVPVDTPAPRRRRPSSCAEPLPF